MTYYPAFDYLRFILAIVVVAAHSGLFTWKYAGGYAVQAFFALSGFLIGGILLRSKPTDLPRFYFNRAARIWIPYFVAILLLMSASLLKERVTGKWLEIFFYDSTFVYDFFGPPQLAHYGNAMPLRGTGNHLWSICAEEQFYLCAPFLITILPLKIGKSVWFWSVLSAIALASIFWDFFGSISLGVLASVLRGRFGNWHSVRSARITLAVIAVTAFGATYLDLIPYRIGAPLSTICIVLFFAQTGRHSRIAMFVGGVSYQLYLNQWIGAFISNFVFGKFGLRNTWSCHLFNVLLSLAVTSGLYSVIDRTVRENRERYFTVFRGKIVAVVGVALVTIGLVGGLLMMQ